MTKTTQPAAVAATPDRNLANRQPDTQLAALAISFGITATDPRALFDAATHNLNQAMYAVCKAGIQFALVQEKLSEYGRPYSQPAEIQDENIEHSDSFEEWIARSDLSKPRVFEAIRIARFVSTLPKGKRQQVIEAGKSKALLLSRIEPEALADMSDEEFSGYTGQSVRQLQDALKREQRENSQLHQQNAALKDQLVIARGKSRTTVPGVSEMALVIRNRANFILQETTKIASELEALFAKAAAEEAPESQHAAWHAVRAAAGHLLISGWRVLNSHCEAGEALADLPPQTAPTPEELEGFAVQVSDLFNRINHALDITGQNALLERTPRRGRPRKHQG